MSRHLRLGAIFVLVSSAPALAYIDPVTASIVLQALIGGFAAFLIAVRRVRERFFGMFRRIFGMFRRNPAEAKGKSEDQNH